MSTTTQETKSLEELARQINATHHSCRSFSQRAAEHASIIGELLLEAKTAIGHGDWSEWIAGNCQFSMRTAQQYMRIAKRWTEIEAKAQNSALLSIDECLDVLAGERNVHVANNSGENEWYTPADYIDASRNVMGGIDLDPASSVEANEVVGALQFFSIKENGLGRDWTGRVFLNPPYSQPQIGEFAGKLALHARQGDIEQAVVLVNNATETRWFQSLMEVASACCFPASRIRFWNPEKTSSTPLQGQAVIYVGSNYELFSHEFSRFGKVCFSVEAKS